MYYVPDTDTHARARTKARTQARTHIHKSSGIRAFLVAQNFIFLWTLLLGRDSSGGIAARYGLDIPGIEFRWGVRFSATV